MKRPVRYPCARQIESIMAQTEPLPFVPATWMTFRGRAISRSRAAAWKPPLLKFVQQTPGIFQPEFDPEALEAVKPGERLFDNLIGASPDVATPRPARPHAWLSPTQFTA